VGLTEASIWQWGWTARVDSEGVRLVAGWEQWESGGWWVLVDYGMYRRFHGDGSGAKVHALRFRPLIVPQTAD